MPEPEAILFVELLKLPDCKTLAVATFTSDIVKSWIATPVSAVTLTLSFEPETVRFWYKLLLSKDETEDVSEVAKLPS